MGFETMQYYKLSNIYIYVYTMNVIKPPIWATCLEKGGGGKSPRQDKAGETDRKFFSCSLNFW